MSSLLAKTPRLKRDRIQPSDLLYRQDRCSFLDYSLKVLLACADSVWCNVLQPFSEWVVCFIPAWNFCRLVPLGANFSFCAVVELANVGSVVTSAIKPNSHCLFSFTRDCMHLWKAIWETDGSIESFSSKELWHTVCCSGTHCEYWNHGSSLAKANASAMRQPNSVTTRRWSCCSMY